MMNGSVFKICVLALLGSTIVALGTGIQWKSGIEDQSACLSGDEIKEVLDFTVSKKGMSRLIVSFEKVVSVTDRDSYEASGLILQDYLGNNSYFAVLDASKADPAILSSCGISNARPILREYKMDNMLINNQIPAWAVVNMDDLRKLQNGDIDNENEIVTPEGETIVAVYVLFFPDVDLETQAVELVHKHGGWVRSRMLSINGMVVEISMSDLSSLVDESAVQYIETPLPKMSPLNLENRVRTGADIVNASPYGLDGTGVTVLVYDGGTAYAAHNDFEGRLTVRDSSGEHDHPTHVAGTIGAGGTSYPGMAPGVIMESYGLEQVGGLHQGFLYSDPGDLEADYTEAINTYYADIANNSIGTNTASNNYPCEWEGNYGTTSILIDSIVRGSVSYGEPFRIVWANGNERGSGRCGDYYLTTAPPACAKNHITVGALNSNDDSVSYFTSWGPTDDGRMKPDISAPGCQVGGDEGVTSLTLSGYDVKCGTSMAAPTVTGLAALLLEDYRVQFPTLPDFRNSTLKIFLAQTAVDIGNEGPDNQSGYGSVRIQEAIDFMREGNFLEGTVENGGGIPFTVEVNPSDTELKITMAWDDVPGTANICPVLVNDLDLVVVSPSGVQVFPWTLSQSDPGAPATQTMANRKDNIEQVCVTNPETGIWYVEVAGYHVPDGPQPFSICSSHSFENCVDAGIVAITNQKYPFSETDMYISVIDCGLNLSASSIDTVDVTVVSSTDTTGETVTLTETSENSAFFRGVLSLSPQDESGKLQISLNDTIVATYNDLDDGTGNPQIVTSTAYVASAIYVSTTTDPDEDGSATHPFDTIQEGIDLASQYDHVICADGTYSGDGNRDLSFDGKQITVRSMSGSDNCIIHCGSSFSDSHRAFDFDSFETEDSVLDGFTIRNGWGRNDEIEELPSTIYGGAIFCYNSAPTIRNCVFKYCLCNCGSAFCNVNASPLITNCTFTNQAAFDDHGIIYNQGNNNFVRESGPSIVDCLFSNNSISCIFNQSSEPLVSGSVFLGNSSEFGAICSTESAPVIANCMFVGNGNTSAAGGALFFTDSIGALVYNCVFNANEADQGGAVHNTTRSNIQIINCTFYGNIAHNTLGADGGALYNWGNYLIGEETTCLVRNCIFWMNVAQSQNHIYEDLYSPVYSSYSLIPGEGGTGNISSDPLFIDPDGADDTPGSMDDVFRLQGMSPCIDAANNDVVPDDVDVDLDGLARFFDAPNTNDTGNGTAPIVDMGAFEYRETDVGTVNSVAYHGTTYGDMGIQVYPPQVIMGYDYSCEPRQFETGESHRLDIALNQAIPSNENDITVTATDAFTFSQSAAVTLNAAGDTITAVFDPLLPNNRIYTIGVSSAYINDMNFEYVVQTGNLINLHGMNVVNSLDKGQMLASLGSNVGTYGPRFDISRAPTNDGAIDMNDKTILESYLTGSAARLVSAVSVANHGVTEGNLGIQVWPVPAGSTIGNCEPRILTEQTLVLTFDGDVSGAAVNMTVEAEDTSSNTYTAAVARSGNTATAVFNPALPDEKIYTVTIGGCATGTFEYVVLGGNCFNVGASLNTVDIYDENELNAYKNQVPSVAGPEWDVNPNGLIHDDDDGIVVDREGNYAS